MDNMLVESVKDYLGITTDDEDVNRNISIKSKIGRAHV